MNNVITRTLTGIVFIGLIVGALTFTEYAFLLFFPIVMLLCLNEFFTIVKVKSIEPQKVFGLIVGLGVFVVTSLFTLRVKNGGMFALLLVLIFIAMIFELFRKKEYPFHNIAFTIMGVFYIALPFSLLVPIAYFSGNYNYEVVLSMFVLLWSYDTGAYVVGMLIGKHRLFERISPKKSWEGSIGGTVIAIGISYVLSLFFTTISFQNYIIFTLIVVVFGTFGDLVESLLKRYLEIKDSGKSLPGHGGFLDRFDSFIFVVPAVYTYLHFI